MSGNTYSAPILAGVAAISGFPLKPRQKHGRLVDPCDRVPVESLVRILEAFGVPVAEVRPRRTGESLRHELYT